LKHVMRMALMVGVAVGAWAVLSDHGFTQAADPNAAPNPYTMQENWLQLPEGRKLGAAIKVQADHSDGKSIWVFDRCSSNACAPIPPHADVGHGEGPAKAIPSKDVPRIANDPTGAKI
jgi:hypothetical protein